MARIVMIGGGGFAKEVQDIAIQAGHQVVGYVADKEGGAVKLDYLGKIEDLPKSTEKFDGVVIAFGAIDRQSLAARRRTIDTIAALGLRPISVISPHARICTGARIGDGSIITHNVVICVDAVVGKHCIFNNISQLGHDSVLGDNVTVAPAAFIAGKVTIGEDSLIGPSTSVLQGRKLGRNVIVSVGATVLRDIPEKATVLPSRSRVVLAGGGTQ